MEKIKKLIGLILLSSFFAFFSFVIFFSEANSIEIKPESFFVSLKQEEIIGGVKEIKLKAEGAIGVEFYYKRIFSLTPIYLGKGIKTQDNFWTLSFNSQSIPNNKYYLYSEITNLYGKYEGEEMLIEIKNKQEKEINKREEIKKNIEEEKEKIAVQEKEIIEKKEQVKRIVLEEIKMFSKEMPKETLVNVHQKTENEIISKIDELTDKIKEEVVKEIDFGKKKEEKEKIENTLKPLKKENEEILKNKPKVLFLEAFNFLKEDKEKNIKEKEGKIETLKGEIKSVSEGLEKTRIEKGQIKQRIKEDIDKKAETIVRENPEAKDAVQKKLQNAQNKASEQLESLEKIVLEKEKNKQKEIVAVIKDSDNDGITDEEEIKINTDPFNPDSDGDGYLDGVEREAGFNPLDSSPTDKIIYEAPEKSKAIISENYKIKRVEIIELSPGEKRIKIEGQGIPNSFVTIYLYSQPLVLITKVDANGNFVYILDKPLDEGVHRVYVAIADNKGKIKERSEVFNFLKTSTAIAAIVPPVFPEEVASPAKQLYNVYTLLVASVIILSLGLSLIIIDILVRRKRNV